MDCRTNGLSDQWTLGPIDCRTNGLLDQWTIQFVADAIHPAAIQYICRTNGLSDQWTVGPMNCTRHLYLSKHALDILKYFSMAILMAF